MKLREEAVRIAAPDGEIRSVLITPVDGGRGHGVVLYTDIFQLTESTLRTARWLASYGFVVCVPEIYPHGELAGVALEFDDAGKEAGMSGAAATPTARFDADRVAVVEDGKISELGSHDQLIASEGSYAALWQSWHGESEGAPA